MVNCERKMQRFQKKKKKKKETGFSVTGFHHFSGGKEALVDLYVVIIRDLGQLSQVFAERHSKSRSVCTPELRTEIPSIM